MQVDLDRVMELINKCVYVPSKRDHTMDDYDDGYSQGANDTIDSVILYLERLREQTANDLTSAEHKTAAYQQWCNHLLTQNNPITLNTKG